MRDCGSFHRFPGVFHGPLLCRLRLPLGLCPRSHLRIQHLRLHGPVRVPCGHHAVPDLPAAALQLPGLLLLHGFRCLLFLLRRLRRAPLGFHLPQHLPGLCRRFGQLHPVCLGKGRAVRFVGRVRGKQLDGPACQGPAVHRFGQLLHRRVAALHCLRFRLPFQPQARPLGRAVARRRLREFVPQGFPLGDRLSPVGGRCRVSGGKWFSCRRSRLMRGRFLLLLVICSRSGRWGSVQRRAHPAQLRAHGTAQRAGCAARQAALQCRQKGVAVKQLLRRLLVAQSRVNGLVRIGLHKGLHGVVDAAGHRIRHRRVLLRQYAVVCHAAHHVRQLARQRVLGVVAAHGPGKVCRAHAVDGPPRTELRKAAHQRLARALALVNALAHSFRAALGAQHRQHQRRADARHSQVLRRTGGNAHGCFSRLAHARLGRCRALLAVIVQLVAKACVLVQRRFLHRPGNAAAHGVNFALVVPHAAQILVGVLGIIIHVHRRDQVLQLFAPGIAFQLLVQCCLVFLRGADVLHTLGGHLARHGHRRRHRGRNALCGVRRAACRPLCQRQGIILPDVRPRLVDLLRRVPHLQQVAGAVLLLCAGHLHSLFRGHALVLLGGVFFLPQQVYHLPVPGAFVHPLVQLVKAVGLPILGKGVSHLLRRLGVASVGALRNGPLFRGVVAANIVPVRFVVLLPVRGHRASRVAGHVRQHLLAQLVRTHRAQHLPGAAGPGRGAAARSQPLRLSDAFHRRQL